LQEHPISSFAALFPEESGKSGETDFETANKKSLLAATL
jgi:hypothetical protein